MMSTLEKYAGYKSSDFPDFGAMEGYLAATLFIKGLQATGKDLTRTNYMHTLRKVSDYNAGGLMSNTIDYTTIFGHNPNPQCSFFLKAGTTTFVPVDTTPVCGTQIPNSDQIANPSTAG